MLTQISIMYWNEKLPWSVLHVCLCAHFWVTCFYSSGYQSLHSDGQSEKVPKFQPQVSENCTQVSILSNLYFRLFFNMSVQRIGVIIHMTFHNTINLSSTFNPLIKKNLKQYSLFFENTARTLHTHNIVENPKYSVIKCYRCHFIGIWCGNITERIGSFMQSGDDIKKHMTAKLKVWKLFTHAHTHKRLVWYSRSPSILNG